MPSGTVKTSQNAGSLTLKELSDTEAGRTGLEARRAYRSGDTPFAAPNRFTAVRKADRVRDLPIMIIEIISVRSVFLKPKMISNPACVRVNTVAARP